ncbi:MAG: hypothetical protein Q8N53_00505 [Longimicrobiales bacterium]|nr:hypothetical protein [Longimicrobiales bacterium]
MPELERIFVVDRREGPHLWLIADEDAVAVRILASALPFPVQDGACLWVRVDQGGGPDWTSARLDRDLQERRLEEAREALARLRRRDPGGDIVL